MDINVIPYLVLYQGLPIFGGVLTHTLQWGGVQSVAPTGPRLVRAFLFGLVWFYGISTIEGYLMLNPV